MSIRILDIALSLAEDESSLREKVAGILRLSSEKIQGLRIKKKSLDARRKNRIQFVYALELDLPPEEEEEILRKAPPLLKVQKVSFPPVHPPGLLPPKPPHRPVVVGAGPAGLFAALKLAEKGWPPLVLERGTQIPRRIQDVQAFWQERRLDPESNVQFGEGGAGTFSDGKLFTRIHDPCIPQILETFVRFGAPDEILYLQRPHIGTDRLRQVIQAFRDHLVEKGAEFRFQTRLTGLKIAKGALQAAIVNGKEEIPVSLLFLAVGHSARDTQQMLHEAKVAMTSKAFAIGLRIEHPQELIDRIQYGPSAGHPRLPPAEYQLAHRTHSGRAVYSFCMCPGGSVIGASSERQCLVTNGMSDSGRSGPFANSALVVNVGPPDFGGEGSLAGIEFQRIWEKRAFQMGGGSYDAPAQRLMDFLKDRPTASLPPTTFRPGVTPAPLDECLPRFVAQSLREALTVFHRRMPGFCSADAVLIGVETRTSSPIRILRGGNYESMNVRGLYPIGEGAGYAGGIISSALDGLKAAESAIGRLAHGA